MYIFNGLVCLSLTIYQFKGKFENILPIEQRTVQAMVRQHECKGKIRAGQHA
jgi:hypothetical protein